MALARVNSVFFIFFICSALITQAQKVGLLMDSYSTDRWLLDQKLFSDRIKLLGGECLIEVAYGDADEQLRLAKKLIASKVDVLVVVPTDAIKARQIATLSKQAGIPLISYDRLILSPDIDIYISYNNEKVGQLQASYMLSRYPKGKYILINGPESDNNAILLRKGQLEVLKPSIDNKNITLLKDYVMTDWSEIGAFEKMKEFLAEGLTPDVIIAANDALANGILQALPPSMAGKVAISGMDADLTGIRNIIAGTQSMTIYKPIRPLADEAATMAMNLATGKKIEASPKVHFDDLIINSVMLDPIVVDKSNYKETVIKDGHASLSEVLKNLSEVFEQERSKVQLSFLQKEKALEVEKKINQRNTFIIISIFFVVSIAGLTFTLYHKQKNNKLLNVQNELIEKKNEALNESNKMLQALNEELLQQQEEISSQHDAISQQKEKLQEVNNIIEKQKNEIQRHNETLEAEVERRTEDLVQNNKQLEQYAFATAHNLRAPVARIIGLGNLLQKQQSDFEETQFIIKKVVTAAQELDTVITDLNSILDVRTFSMEVLTEVNLDDELHDITESLRNEITQTGTNIDTDFTEVNTIYTIKPYIHSILFNLISNSIKYRATQRTPVIKVRTERKKGQVCIVVADNGIGIDLSVHQDKIFQLYKRFHFHTEGRGIGLFLVKTQIDSLGGDIKIESQVDEGTTFRVFLDDPNAKNGFHSST